MDTNLNQVLVLSDGRRLGYSQLGDPDGIKVFFTGGFPGSRLMVDLFLGRISAGISLVGLDRPGAGLSDFKPGWNILDWPADVIQLADHLGASKFAVLGWSGGTPYAAACVVKYPERILACGLISGMGSPDLSVEGAIARNQIWRFLARTVPWMIKPMLWFLYGRFDHNPEKFIASLKNMQAEISGPDRAAYAETQTLHVMAQGMAEAYRQGTHSQAYEARLLYRPWGFRFSDLKGTNIFLWHGEKDMNIPVSIGKAIADQIPGIKATFFPDEGHLSVITNRGRSILESLLSMESI